MLLIHVLRRKEIHAEIILDILLKKPLLLTFYPMMPSLSRGVLFLSISHKYPPPATNRWWRHLRLRPSLAAPSSVPCSHRERRRALHLHHSLQPTPPYHRRRLIRDLRLPTSPSSVATTTPPSTSHRPPLQALRCRPPGVSHCQQRQHRGDRPSQVAAGKG